MGAEIYRRAQTAQAFENKQGDSDRVAAHQRAFALERLN